MRKILLLLTFACLVSCVSGVMQEEKRMPLEIMADVAAYNQNVNDLSTKASINNGVFTSFAIGDDLGLFAVDKDGTLVADNYRYVLQKTGNIYRVDASGNVIASDVYYDRDYTYFAYAPYNSRYNGCISIDEIVEKYKSVYPALYADQSTQEKYNEADLLVCKTPQQSGLTLYLSFTHAMSLMKIFYNGEDTDLTVEHPVSLSQMYRPEGAVTYSYICLPENDVEVYGTALSKQTDEGEESEVKYYSYWQTNINLVENHSLYISIYSQPTVSYKTAGVDMGFPSGCIWANHNLGAESASDLSTRGGVWYDADGNPKTELMESELHSCFDRGDYYSWGELVTKYGKPAVLFSTEGSNIGRISATGDSYNGTNAVTPLVAGSDKGYYPETYIDRKYTYADIDGNIAGTEYDVVRNKLWKGEWRIPNENEIDELMRNCDIEVYDWYYEDNVRYAQWIAEKDDEGNYVNLHPDNSEFFGTDDVRPYRYLITIFKFTSKINGEVLYFPGGTWSDWSIDMLATNSRNYHGLKTAANYSSDYGGMYYFASSASHDHHDCSSYMEMETSITVDSVTGKIINVIPVRKRSSYVDSEGNTINLEGLTQNGHRYTGMLIRPVYGGRNWNINTPTQSSIRINVEER
ncbi:MAG: fimbrillin family protein [Candidatus Cryptobacteroides sp.]